MDLFTTVVSTALTQISERVIDDAYQKLKALVKQKWGKNSNLAKAIEELEQTPSSQGRRIILAEEVAHVGADKDPEVLALLHQIKKLCGNLGEQLQINAAKEVRVDTKGKGYEVAVDGGQIKIEHKNVAVDGGQIKIEHKKGMGVFAWLLIIVITSACLWGIFQIIRSLQERMNISQTTSQITGTWAEQGELLAGTRRWTFYKNGTFLFTAILVEEKGTWIINSNDQLNLHITQSDTLMNNETRYVSCRFELYDEQLILTCAGSKPIHLRKLH